MKILYHKNFLKDLASILHKQRKRIEDLVFDPATKASTLQSLGIVEKLKGSNHYYKIRVGDYRIGLHFQPEVLTFERILHRKEIYRFYP